MSPATRIGSVSLALLAMAALTTQSALAQFSPTGTSFSTGLINPFSCVLGDFDNDGDLDAAVSSSQSGGSLRIMRNNGSGAFTALPTISISSLPADLVAGDVNGDGNLDLVSSSNTTTGVIDILIGNGNNGFIRIVQSCAANPRRLRLADIDGVNGLDIIIAATPGEVRFNDGAGNFTASQTFPNNPVTNDLVTVDYDLDGDLDIFCTLQGTLGVSPKLRRLRHNSFNGTSVSWTVNDQDLPSLGNFIERGDINLDGRPDVTVAYAGPHEFSPWILNSSGVGNPQGPFSTGGSGGPGDFALVDIDGDGDLDFVAPESTDGTIVVMERTATGGYVLRQRIITNTNLVAESKVGDVDGDGTLDIVGLSPTAANHLLVFTGIPQAEQIDFRKPMISEVSAGNPDFVEITNFDTVTRSLAGWTIRWKDGSVATSVPLTESLLPGESLVVMENGGTLNLPGTFQSNNALPFITTTTSDFAVALFNDSGLNVDEVHVATPSGSYGEGSLGGTFRGFAVPVASGVGGSIVERIWGLDSNSGGDWTGQTDESAGFENLSSGPRGTDPIALPSLRINELDDSPDLIEIQNTGPSTLTVANWLLLCSNGQGSTQSEIPIFTTPVTLAPGAFVVLGESPSPPAEVPGSVPYFDVMLNIPWNSGELDCAIYDNLGRLIDVVRTTGSGDELTHNHPRSPSAWDDFGGAARRIFAGDSALARISDTKQGTDWRVAYTRTMGSPNSGMLGALSQATNFDYRVNDGGGAGGGLTIIVNAGPANAGNRVSIFPSYVRTFGSGPFFGLGTDALNYWFLLNTVEPWGGVLGADGAWRFDFPRGSFPTGATTDVIAVMQDPAGAFISRTLVLYYDS